MHWFALCIKMPAYAFWNKHELTKMRMNARFEKLSCADFKHTKIKQHPSVLYRCKFRICYAIFNFKIVFALFFAIYMYTFNVLWWPMMLMIIIIMLIVKAIAIRWCTLKVYFYFCTMMAEEIRNCSHTIWKMYERMYLYIMRIR